MAALMAGPLVALSIALSVYRRQLLDARDGRMLALRLELELTIQMLRDPQKEPFTVRLQNEEIKASLFTIDAPALSRAAEHPDLQDEDYRQLLKLLGNIGSHNRRFAAMLASLSPIGMLPSGSSVAVFATNLRGMFVDPLLETQVEIEISSQALLTKLKDAI